MSAASNERPIETPVELPGRQPVETPATPPVEDPIETPDERPSRSPIEEPSQQPDEQPGGDPTVNRVQSIVTMKCARAVAMTTVMVALAACTTPEPMPAHSQFGVEPQLPGPQSSLLPSIHVAPAKGWEGTARPTAAAGLAVDAFATGLDHPRWLYVLPNGDVLVAETNAPERPDDSRGVKGWFQKIIMKRAGSVTPSANRITLLRDADGDGKAEVRSALLTNLQSPFGIALVGSDLYIANADSLVKFPYQAGQTEITAAAQKVADLPGGTINHHWTKNVIADPSGSHLYVTVGSNSNVAENGMDKEENRAAILEIDPASGVSRVYASGLRNPNGMAWHTPSSTLWTVVNERDELGDDLVPDYLTSVREGAFYGWPYSYYGQHIDERVKPQRPDLVSRAVVPDYALGSHTASLGLAIYDADGLPARYRGGAFIGQHGSWNRKPRSGYEVIFVPFVDGKPAGKPESVLNGFVDDNGDARGRPVGVAVDSKGAILVADDVGNVVWRVTSAAGPERTAAAP